MGRSKAVDPQKRELICTLVGIGFSRYEAARHVGVGRTTMYRALKEDPAFADLVRQAGLHQELRPLKQIADQGAINWRASAWLLERMRADMWAKRPPDVVTLADMHGIFEAMMKMLLEGVPEAAWRKRVTRNFDRFFQRLGGRKRCSPRVRLALRELELDQSMDHEKTAAKPQGNGGPEATTSESVSE